MNRHGGLVARGTLHPAVLRERDCAFVLAGRSRVMVLPRPATQPEKDHEPRSLAATLARRIGVDTIALVDAGAADSDLSFEVWPLRRPAYSRAGQQDAAVACAIMARLHGLVLAEPVLVAQAADDRFELVSPPGWWCGIWLVRAAHRHPVPVPAQLLFHGELVLAGQPMSGSASGVMFITIEDEGGIADPVVWPCVFACYRRIVLGSRMLGVSGRVQRQGEVIHLVVERLEDLSGLQASVGLRDQPEHKPRDIYIRDLRLGSGIKVPTRDFR